MPKPAARVPTQHGQPRRLGTLGSIALVTSCLLPLGLLLLHYQQQAEQLAARLEEAERRLFTYEALEQRSGNPTWQEDIEAAKQRRLANETSQPFVDTLFDTPSRRFPHGHDLSGWQEHLQETTPAAFGDAADVEDGDAPYGPSWCSELGKVVISEAELHNVPPQPDGSPLSPATRERALAALRECGYVYLDNFYPAEKVHRLRRAYQSFRDTPEAKAFEYPCQGPGRREHMLPFRQPFNDSSIYADARLRRLLGDFLGEEFKLELMTVITSPPGSRHQRWHQGWRYLFHPDERLPPFAVVVALPLDDVTPEMGPTEMCPGKKRRFYYGWRCEISYSICKVVFALSSFPFLFLMIGVVNRLLTHATRTAYNEHGQLTAIDQSGLSAYLRYLRQDILENPRFKQEVRFLSSHNCRPSTSLLPGPRQTRFLHTSHALLRRLSRPTCPSPRTPTITC